MGDASLAGVVQSQLELAAVRRQSRLKETHRHQAVSHNEPGNDHADHAHQFDENIEAWSAGVLEGIAHGVADHAGLMGFGTFAAEVSSLDILLRVIP